MIKRFTVLLLAVIYLSVSTGFTVNIHYCLGILTSVSLSGKMPCTCKDGVPDLCCKTTKVKVSLKDTYSPHTAEFSFVDAGNLPVVAARLLPVVLLVISPSSPLPGKAPPDLSKPIYLRSQNFRI